MPAGLSYYLDLDSGGFVRGAEVALLSLRDVEIALDRTNPLLRTLAAGFAALGASLAAGKALQAGDAYANLERRLSLLANTLNRSGQQGNTAQQMLDRLAGIANRAGAPIDSLVSAFDRMAPSAIANGIALDKLYDSFEGTLGALASVGASTEEAQRSFIALGQIVGKNQLQMEELRGQLGEALPTAMLILADGLTQVRRETGQLGADQAVTVSQLQKLIQTGTVGGAEFVEAWARATEQFKIFAQVQQATISGQEARLGNVLELGVGKFLNDSGVQTLYVAVVKRLVDGVDEGLQALVDHAKEYGQAFKDALGEFAQANGGLFDGLGSDLAEIASSVTSLARQMAEGWNALPDDVKKAGLLALLFGGVEGAAAVALLSAANGKVNELGQALQAVADAMKAIKDKGDSLAAGAGKVASFALPFRNPDVAGYDEAAAEGMDPLNVGTAAYEKQIPALESQLDALKAKRDQVVAQLQAQPAGGATHFLPGLLGGGNDTANLDSQLASINKQIDDLTKRRDGFAALVQGAKDAQAESAKAGQAQAQAAQTGTNALTIWLSATEREADAIAKLRDSANQLGINLQQMMGPTFGHGTSPGQVSGVERMLDSFRLAGDSGAQARAAISQIVDDVAKVDQLFGNLQNQKFDTILLSLADDRRKAVEYADQTGSDVASAYVKSLDEQIEQAKAERQKENEDYFKSQVGAGPGEARGLVVAQVIRSQKLVEPQGKDADALQADYLAKVAAIEDIAQRYKAFPGVVEAADQAILDIEKNYAEKRVSVEEAAAAKRAEAERKLVKEFLAAAEARQGAVEAYAVKVSDPDLFAVKVRQENANQAPGAFNLAAKQDDAGVQAIATDNQLKELTKERVVLEAQLGAARNGQVQSAQAVLAIDQAAKQLEDARAATRASADPAVQADKLLTESEVLKQQTNEFEAQKTKLGEINRLKTEQLALEKKIYDTQLLETSVPEQDQYTKGRAADIHDQAVKAGLDTRLISDPQAQRDLASIQTSAAIERQNAARMELQLYTSPAFVAAREADRLKSQGEGIANAQEETAALKAGDPGQRALDLADQRLATEKAIFALKESKGKDFENEAYAQGVAALQQQGVELARQKEERFILLDLATRQQASDKAELDLEKERRPDFAAQAYREQADALAKSRLEMEQANTAQGLGLQLGEQRLANDKLEADLARDARPEFVTEQLRAQADQLERQRLAIEQGNDARAVANRLQELSNQHLQAGQAHTDEADPLRQIRELNLDIDASKARGDSADREIRMWQSRTAVQEWASAEVKTAQAKADAADAELKLYNDPKYLDALRQQNIAGLKKNDLDTQIQIRGLVGDDPKTTTEMRVNDLWKERLKLAQAYYQYTMPAEQRWTQALNGTMSFFVEHGTSTITSLIEGTTDLKTAIKSFAADALDGVIKFFVQWGLQFTATKILQMTGMQEILGMQATTTAASTAIHTAATAEQTATGQAAAASTTAAWTPAAVATSIASFGGAMIAGLAVMALLSGLLKFHDGGDIVAGGAGSGMPGLDDDEKLIIAKHGEKVLNPREARSYDAMMRRGASTVQGPRPTEIAADRQALAGAHASMRSPVQVVNFFDHRDVERHLMKNPQAILNIMSRDQRDRGRYARSIGN